MSAPRIERGPMTAEVLERDYARIGNRLLRDPEISYKAKGIFAFMASHKDGFGVSPESIAAAGQEGISAVKSALRELEQGGYLARSQKRTEGGTMGQTVYRITDMPSSEPVDGNRPAVVTSGNDQSCRSEPVDGNPLAVHPPAADHPHKKTIPLQEDQLIEDEFSLPSLPAQRSEPDPVHEREISASIKPSTPQQLVRAANVVTLDEEEAFVSWTVATHQPRSAAWWRAVAKNGDLPALAAQWRTTGGRQPLTGPDANVMGWLALADQLGGKDKKHQPYNNNVWDDMHHQLESGARPDGWEQVPHCGHIDCDPISRARETEDGNGLKSLTWCSACHPNLQF